MREIYKGGVTPQQKLVGINNKFGNTGIKDQQGTSRIIYDTLPTTGVETTFRFFTDSASRNFPFTNTGSDGNKLGVGDTMVIEKVAFYVYTRNNTSGQLNFGSVTQFPATGLESLGVFSFEIANNRVIKNVPLTEGTSIYDKSTTANNNTGIALETQIVIPPLLNFELELKLAGPVSAAGAGSTKYIVCAIIGTGGIIAPRTTF